MSADDARLRALEKRLAEAEERSKRAVDLATAATKRATESLAQIDGIGAGLVSHLARLEAIRLAEADADKQQRESSEATRKAAAETHRKRFDEQGAAIHAMTEHLRLAAARTQHAEKASERGKWILGAVVAIITTLSMQAVEAVKIIYAPAPAQQAPK